MSTTIEISLQRKLGICGLWAVVLWLIFAIATVLVLQIFSDKLHFNTYELIFCSMLYSGFSCLCLAGIDKLKKQPMSELSRKGSMFFFLFITTTCSVLMLEALYELLIDNQSLYAAYNYQLITTAIFNFGIAALSYHLSKRFKK
jgi:hypothetical protein